MVAVDPHISVRKIQRYPKSIANRILKIYKFHHINLTQALAGRDFIRRVNFCNWAVNQIRRDPFFFRTCFSLIKPHFIIEEVLIDITVIIIQTRIHIQRNQEFQRQWSINV